MDFFINHIRHFIKQCMNKYLLIRLSVVIFLCSIQLLYTKWFLLEIEIFSWRVNIIYWYCILFLAWLILEYKLLRKKNSSDDWYKLLFWSLSLITIILLYSCYIKVFIDLPYVKDYIIQTKWINLAISYSLEFKLDYFHRYMDYYFINTKTFSEKKVFISTIFNETILIELLNRKNVNINYIREYVNFITDISSSCFDNKEHILHYYDKMTFDSHFAVQVFCLIRNTLYITFYLYFTLVFVPTKIKFLIITYFKAKWIPLIHTYLRQYNIIVDDNFILNIIELLFSGDL